MTSSTSPEKPKSESSHDGETKPKESSPGMASYFVCYLPFVHGPAADLLKRIFKYADRKSWTFNIIAFVAAIASGTLLPLMNLIFGKFVTTFTKFATGDFSPAQYRAEVNKFTLYFVYLFIARFALFYLHSVSVDRPIDN